MMMMVLTMNESMASSWDELMLNVCLDLVD